MLKTLVISNYAIINHLEIQFNNGLNIITGETGAGKSIMLGALSLILGQRADTSVLKNQGSKCFVEGVFDVGRYDLKGFFEQNDLDYDNQAILRREIAINGKSRAFINDIPVNLNVMKELGIQLIDIHSQHESLNLQDNQFQLRVLDLLADNDLLLNDYKALLQQYGSLKNDLSRLKEETEKLKSDREYFEYQLNELEKAALKEGEIEELEAEHNALTHSEEIKELLAASLNLLSDEGLSVIGHMRSIMLNLDKLKTILPETAVYHNRLESIYIELKDIESDIDRLNTRTLLDPERLEFVNGRLNAMYLLQKKHNAKNLSELLKIKDDYKNKLEHVYFSDEKILALENQIMELHGKITQKANELSSSRKKTAPFIEAEVNRLLAELGMPKASFKINIGALEYFSSSGTDQVQFLFAPARDIGYQDLSKTASGGEISRLMLSIKSMMAHFNNLPTIVFDEIDAGISGEIADKTGNIIKKMSGGMQVINITHLPQVASKGDCHYKVFKTEVDGVTETKMKLLGPEERVVEVAKMLSGAELSEAAILNARELLKK